MEYQAPTFAKLSPEQELYKDSVNTAVQAFNRCAHEGIMFTLSEEDRIRRTLGPAMTLAKKLDTRTSRLEAYPVVTSKQLAEIEDVLKTLSAQRLDRLGLPLEHRRVSAALKDISALTVEK